MKTFFLLPVLFAAFSNYGSAQTLSLDTARLTFVATYILPRTSPSVPLTGGRYGVQISPDSIHSLLPFRGRSYVAPVHPDSAGILFSSSRFRKQSTRTQKGGWRIAFEPRDVREQYRFVLEVARNGAASLQVFSNRRDMVGFEGYIEGMGH